MLQTLACSKNYWSIYDYEQIFGLQPCSQAPGLSLLCVVDRKQRHRDRHDIKVFDLGLMKNVKFRWPQQFVGLPTKDTKDYYVAGNDIVLWNEQDEENQNFREFIIR